MVTSTRIEATPAVLKKSATLYPARIQPLGLLKFQHPKFPYGYGRARPQLFDFITHRAL
jgi:hypothetical protein